LLAALLLPASTAAGVPPAQPAQAKGPNAPPAFEPGVPQVRSRVAWEAALAAEAEGRYEAAARAFLKLAGDCGDDPVPAGPGLYRPLAEEVLRRVAGWPAEARGLYRRACDATGRGIVAEAVRSGDPAAMARAAERFPLAGNADEAWRTAAELFWEGGRIGRAADCWDRLLTLAEPAVDAEAVRTLRLRLAVARLRLGDRSRGERDLRDILDDAPADSAAGRAARARLKRLASEPAVVVAKAAREGLATAWPLPVASVPAPAPREGEDRSPGRIAWMRTVEGPEGAPRQDEFPAPLMPAVSADALHFNSGRWATAWRLADGEVLWRTRILAEGTDEVADPTPLAPTLDAERVYVRAPTEPGDADAFRRWDGPFGRILALDRRDGKVLWTVGSSITPPPSADGKSAKIDALSFESPPLPHRGRLYVLARRRPPRLRETQLAVCLDPATGKPLWATPISDEGSESTSRSTCLPTPWGDGVLFPTGVGAVACVDADDGRIRWVATYDRPAVEPDDPPAGRRGGAQVIERPVVFGGRFALLPANGCGLLVFDAATGRRLASYPKAELGMPRAMTGVVATPDGPVAVLAGDKVVGVDLETGAVRWRIAIDPTFCGAGCLRGGRAYIPTAGGPLAVEAATGKVVFSPAPTGLAGAAGTAGPMAEGEFPTADVLDLGAMFLLTDPRRIAVLYPGAKPAGTQ
jgi:outer membrane protein assembly factor BamB